MKIKKPKIAIKKIEPLFLVLFFVLTFKYEVTY